MAKFSVDFTSKHSPEAAYLKVKELLVKGDDLKKYDSNLECVFDDQKQSCQIKSNKFSAELFVKGQGASGSDVSIFVDLPLLLMPFKSKIRDSLSRMLQKHLS
jgi:hypothetical protein